MYTANTMASAIEALGMSMPNSSTQIAISEEKKLDCRRAGEAILALVRAGIRPSGVLAKYARLVSTASEGAVTDKNLR
jgi:dihydroxy-acid dehydratase